MGPRFENRGYGNGRPVVGYSSCSFNGSTVREPWLCWLHGQRRAGAGSASMGPRSENRGYDVFVSSMWDEGCELQWVHGPRTVVMDFWLRRGQLEQGASMGTRFENRGYEVNGRIAWPSSKSFNGSTVREPWLSRTSKQGVDTCERLQWVHGSRTVVNPRKGAAMTATTRASMGPRFENRG